MKMLKNMLHVTIAVAAITAMSAGAVDKPKLSGSTVYDKLTVTQDANLQADIRGYSITNNSPAESLAFHVWATNKALTDYNIDKWGLAIGGGTNGKYEHDTGAGTVTLCESSKTQVDNTCLKLKVIPTGYQYESSISDNNWLYFTAKEIIQSNTSTQNRLKVVTATDATNVAAGEYVLAASATVYY